MTREEELYKLYEQGFEKVLALLLQKQKMGKYDKYEKTILFEINKILNKLERETFSYSKKDMPTLYEGNRASVLAAAGVTEIPTMVGIDKRAIIELQKVFDNQIYDGINQVKKNIHSVVRKMALEQKISGGKTSEKVSEAVEFLSKQNIFTFEDKLGRIYSLESYAEMAIKTIQSAAINKSVFNASLQLKNDLVKMSSHSTSCPICAMYQGRIYSITGKTKGYPPLSIINNGAVVQYSVLHPNCRHRFTAYIKELDDNVEENKKLSNQPFIDNRTEEQKQAYDNRQRQNRLKSQYIKLKELRAVTVDKIKIKAIDNRMRVLRGKIRDIKNLKIDTTPAIIKKIEVVRNTNGELYTKFGGKHYDNIQKIVKESDDLEKQLWIKAEDRLQIADAKSRKNGAYYSRLEGITVNIEKSSLKSEYQKPYQTIFHEFGHNIDWLVNEKKSEFSTDYQDGIFEKTIRKEFADKLAKYRGDMKEHFKVYEKDFDKLYELNYITKNQAEYLKETNGKISDFLTYDTLVKKVSRDIIKMGTEKNPCLSDILEGVSDGRIKGGFGHGGAAYWKRRGNLSRETFAHMFETSITKNTEQLEAIKSFFPESYEIYKQMVKEMINKL